MLSYDQVLKIPTGIGLHIIDAIDSRDHIINHLLEKIENKYDTLIVENKKLKEKLDKFENNKNSTQTFPLYHLDNSNLNLNINICNPFVSRDYPYDSSFLTNPSVHLKIYNELYPIISSRGRIIILDFENKNLANDEELNINSDNEEAYFKNIRHKKYLSSLSALCTDYVINNVFVEKVLHRLESIVNYMNHDTEFLHHMFKNFINSNETCKLGIIFKGGNVYKLFTHVISNNLDTTVFNHYLSDIDKYFKKSDCDFSLVFIVTDNLGVSRFLDLDRTIINESFICTLQFMILNKFRNDFLNDKGGYEYLNLCGVNDIVMTNKINNFAINMLTIMHEGRLEFETKLFSLMMTYVNLNLNYPELNSFKSLSSLKTYISTNRNSFETQTLSGILKEYANDYEIVLFNIKAKVVEWYGIFLSYCLRNRRFFPVHTVIPNNILTKEIIDKIQQTETDNMHWNDVLTLYDVKEITSIVIGDNPYHVGTDNINNEQLFKNIIENNNYPNKSVEISAKRMKTLGRLSSNRNDFFIKFIQSKTETQILQTKKIPFDSELSLVTPFYISINKEISGESVVLQEKSNIELWLQRMKRFSDYGSSGYVKKHNNYETTYRNLHDKIYNDKKTSHSNNSVSTENKSINFGLSRLLLNFIVIVKTYNNDYFSFSVPSEYIDLSFTYSGDFKTLTYEKYNDYVLLNCMTNSYIGSIILKYNNIIEYAKNNNPLVVNALYDMNYMIIKEYPIIVNKLEALVKFINLDNYHINTEKLLRILKYFEPVQNRPSCLSYNSIFFPTLSGFIMDLYTILFIDSTFPWTDTKYMKRLQRFIFFTFIECLQEININNITDVMLDLGLNDTCENIIQTVTNNFLISQSYYPSDTINRLLNYNEYRSKCLKDNESIKYNNFNRTLKSTGAIDHFMFSYHLLDFLDIYPHNDSFLRLQFIVKRSNKYWLVSMSMDQIEQHDQIFANIPYTQEDDSGPDIILPNKKHFKQYTLIDGMFLNYIEIIENIREKLIITLYNFVYDSVAVFSNKKNIVPTNSLILLINTYEEDIDKILRVI